MLDYSYREQVALSAPADEPVKLPQLTQKRFSGLLPSVCTHSILRLEIQMLVPCVAPAPTRSRSNTITTQTQNSDF